MRKRLKNKNCFKEGKTLLKELKVGFKQNNREKRNRKNGKGNAKNEIKRKKENLSQTMTTEKIKNIVNIHCFPGFLVYYFFQNPYSHRLNATGSSSNKIPEKSTEA